MYKQDLLDYKTSILRNGEDIMSKKGSAAVFKGAGRCFEIRKYPVVSPSENQVLLSLKFSGICGTDVHIHEGRLPTPENDMIIGHEFIGTIEELGEGVESDGLGQPLEVGDNCIACVAIPCSNCFNCLRGETASCLNFGVTYVGDVEVDPHFFGGFAEYLYSPAVNLVKIPKVLKLESIAAFPCAGPTIIRTFEYGREPESGELVVIQGAGSMGLFATAWAVKKGCHVVVIGSSSNLSRQAIAEQLGAKLVLDYRKTTEEERLEIITELAKSLGRGNGADVVVETSGSCKAFPEGINLLRTRGCYLVPGQYSASGSVEINPELITFKALQITGSGQYTLKDIKSYLEFMEDNQDLSDSFASCINKFTVENVNEAMDSSKSGSSIKTVLVRGD